MAVISISGTLIVTPLPWLPVLRKIASLLEALLRELLSIMKFHGKLADLGPETSTLRVASQLVQMKAKCLKATSGRGSKSKR